MNTFQSLFRLLTVSVLAAFPAISLTPPAQAQFADTVESLEILHVIHTPSAGVLKNGQYRIDVRNFSDGGLHFGVAMGLFNRFMFGVSYGGLGLIGYGDPEWNDLPGMIVKYRIIEESQSLPALSVGFDMQGRGFWSADSQRYQFKAPGAFAAVSRNWMSPYGRFGVHGGVNYNTIEDDGQQTLDGFAAIDFSLNEQLTLLAEYDFALDDNLPDGAFGEGKHGYLNMGIRMTFAQSLVIEVDAVDLFNTSAASSGFGRELKIVYVETFAF